MKAITPAAALWGLMGLAGVAYVVIVARRIRTQSVYEPDFEDWLFHLLMPLAAYALLALSALAASSHADEALFGVGAATLLLLFIGIHNAWDAVAYHALVNKPDRKASGKRGHSTLFGHSGYATALPPIEAISGIL